MSDKQSKLPSLKSLVLEGLNKIGEVGRLPANNTAISREHSMLQVLQQNIRDQDFAQTYTMLRNPKFPPNVLDLMIHHPNVAMRKLVAEHPNATPNMLIRMSSDEDKNVLKSVIKNPNTPQEVKERLLQKMREN